jgi:riboflavin synthase
MFTGLIENIGRVVSIQQQGSAAMLVISTTIPVEEIDIGDSVAVNGVCLTVVAKKEGMLSFDVSPESLRSAGFARLKPGSAVNLERALRLSDRLGGHIVSGHVDCTAVVADRMDISGNTVFKFRIPKEYSRYIVAKGSVTIDGISLTVNEIQEEGFSVNIIPHTAQSTTLHQCRPGDEVNIEVDILAKYVERLLKGANERESGGLTMEALASAGFL